MTRDRAPRPLVRVPVVGLLEGERDLGPAVARYLGIVHRLGVGDRFVAFDPARALEAPGQVVRVNASAILARIEPLEPATVVAQRTVCWVQALPKGDKLDAIVRDATELGVTHIVPATSTYSVVRLDASRQEAKRLRWERIAREAARQCGRGDAPEILPVASWTDALTAAVTLAPLAFCLYEKATTPIGPALLRERTNAITFAAGPEGGLSEDEVASARALGFGIVSLGLFILRTETVAAATLGALGVLEGLS